MISQIVTFEEGKIRKACEGLHKLRVKLSGREARKLAFAKAKEKSKDVFDQASIPKFSGYCRQWWLQTCCTDIQHQPCWFCPGNLSRLQLQHWHSILNTLDSSLSKQSLPGTHNLIIRSLHKQVAGFSTSVPIVRRESIAPHCMSCSAKTDQHAQNSDILATKSMSM